MYGAILGDIIGSPFEFDMGDKTKDFPLFCENSVFTDDSVMTIAVADALLGGERDPEKLKKELVESMRWWGRSEPDAGYGGMFYRWLFTDNPQPYGSYGNGSAMRVAAAGWLYDTLEETREKARLSAEVTHNHPEGIKGAESVAAVIWLARNGKSKQEIREYVTSEFGYDLSRTCDEIRPGYHHMESCQETVPEAITAFLEGESFEDVIRTAVSLGGDCDTLTCIAGSMAEAFYGVPEELKEECRKRITPEMWEVLARFEKRVNACRTGREKMEKGKLVEELLEKPYQVVDFLPEQVPEGSAGQFFAVEKYYMNPERMKGFRKKFADILIRLNCFFDFSVCEAQEDVFTDNPDPEWLEGKILENADLCVLLPEEETLITLYRDDLYMTVYNACGRVLKILEELAERDELFLR